MTKDQQAVWVNGEGNNRMLKFDMNGRLQYWWGAFGGQPGHFWGPHDVSVDSEGNVYIPDLFNGRVQKFRPRKGADPKTLIGLLFKKDP